MKVLVPLGTRPEIIKLAPVVHALERAGFDTRTVATGQHHDPLLTDTFFRSLRLRADDRWSLAGTDGERLGTILERAYHELDTDRPDLVLLLGDTYTVPLFCLAARHHAVPIAHLEAGMRSFNPTSMEEVNRRMAASAASLHLAATTSDARFLEAEGVPPHAVRVVGNPIIDAIGLTGLSRVPPAERRGLLVTVHRRGNVDDPPRLRAIVDLLCRLGREMEPVVFPVHPRTRARLEEAGGLGRLIQSGVQLKPPMGYQHMLELLSRVRVVVTDSGGVQEEASWFGVPLVVLRQSTPRWEGVRAGVAVLCGVDPDRVLAAVRRLATPAEQTRVAAVPCLYGDGHTAPRVAELLSDPIVLDLLRLQEPDFTDGRVPA